MDGACNQLVLDNAVDGFDLHQLDTGQYIQTLHTGHPRWRVPKQAEFAEGGRAIIGGSDHGSIYVWDRRSGELMEALEHSRGGLVQTVTVSHLQLDDG